MLVDAGDTKLLLRYATEDDRAYVRSTFSRSAWDLLRKVRREDWRARGSAVLDALIRGGRVVVACAPEDQQALFGWAAATDGALWYVYVPYDFRGLGLARELVRKVTEREIETC